ncbi:MAG: hypothetical protein EA383_07945 [Spirochaetaceae bacterium]|nr:MAG: hypothetical protein EA383_07945 [Spirochaetaceae bacterium]
MSISFLLKESYRVAKENPLIFVPLLAASVIGILLSLIFVGTALPFAAMAATDPQQITTGEALTGLGAAIGAVFFTTLVSGIIGLFAHAMTVAMADQALKGEKADLKDALIRTRVRIIPVAIAVVLVSVLVGLASLLLVLPGVILSFFLIFTLVSVMTDHTNAFQAIKKSMKTVAGHIVPVFIFFLIVLGLGLVTGLIGGVVGVIPILGVFLTMIVGGAYTGYVTILLVALYRTLPGQGEGSVDAEV